MLEIANSSVHLIVTSPPYPMIQKWDRMFGNTDFEEQHKYLNKTWEECFRVLVDGGILCINIGDATRSIDKNFQCYPNYAKITMNCCKIGFIPLIPIIWKKISNKPNAFLGSGFLPPNAYVTQDCEYIIILRKGKLRDFNITVNKETRRISQYTKEERDQWFQQIWEMPGIRGAKITSKFPLEIPYRLIRMFSLREDIVVDPFCGSGMIGNVAVQLGRQFIGYDIIDFMESKERFF